MEPMLGVFIKLRSDIHYMYVILLIGILIGIPLSFMLCFVTVIDAAVILNFCLAGTVISAGLVFMRKTLRNNIVAYLSCLFGFAPLITALFLFINWLPFNHEETVYTHVIQKADKAGYEDALIEFSDSAYNDMTRLRTFDLAEISLNDPSKGVYVLRKGNCGFDVILSKRVE